MTGYISKEQAAELLEAALEDDWEPSYAIDRLSEISPAAVKPVVRGKWVWSPDKRCWECDQCRETTTDACMGKPRANYCPWCGADMRGEKHEDN